METLILEEAALFKRAKFSTKLQGAELYLASQFIDWALNRQRRELRKEFSRPIHMVQWNRPAGYFIVRAQFREEKAIMAFVPGPVEAARIADMFIRRLKTSSDFHLRFLTYNFSSERAQSDLSEEIEIAILVDRAIDRLKKLYGKPKVFRLIPENKPGQRKYML